ncbi:TPA: hypothetical protein ACKOR7_001735 [Clostridioides difficile]
MSDSRGILITWRMSNRCLLKINKETIIMMNCNTNIACVIFLDKNRTKM